MKTKGAVQRIDEEILDLIRRNARPLESRLAVLRRLLKLKPKEKETKR